ncbi:hypothetical protein [Hymenobacter arizonensis]|uniref:Uncharacterized protein n=1 Tax=Hymenobacter arizonensis TaxID=1227077 RepID=A0A1I5ZQA4_HYMAR|nr:hypothetical protein [Hymenobacter arizonensis]SFQ58357.1 hypothetical protein SAMN04515668_3094 [Hymenobacter arizonensis]
MHHSRVLAATLALFTCLSISSCKKETEIQIKEVEKKYSWTEVSGLIGFERIILSTGSNGQSIYLQQPYYFTRLNTLNRNQGMVVAGGILNGDLSVRLAIGREFFAYPATDSLLIICRNNEPTNNNYEAYVQLRRLDPNAIRFNTRVFNPISKCTAINQNNYLLMSYDNNRPDRPITFLLTAVTPGVPGTRVVASSQRIEIPNSGTGFGAFVRNMAAIDDYFLVYISGAGIYKIKQNGTFRQVYSPATVDAFYKWNNTVYAPVEYNQILTSTDNGETWQLSTGTPDHFTLANYYTVGDSLVGVFQSNLFSLRWNGPRFTSRFLKNDGLERARITGIETLRDTVYVATTSGLFARPIKQFFETKK